MTTRLESMIVFPVRRWTLYSSVNFRLTSAARYEAEPAAAVARRTTIAGKIRDQPP
ncbi:MAG TPA: hypothetical protein VF981_05810 [Gemmatimonadaceae bacterium]